MYYWFSFYMRLLQGGCHLQLRLKQNKRSAAQLTTLFVVFNKGFGAAAV